MQARLIRQTAPAEDIFIRVPMIFEKALLVIHDGEYYIWRETTYDVKDNHELVNVYWHVTKDQLWEESKKGAGG